MYDIVDLLTVISLCCINYSMKQQNLKLPNNSIHTWEIDINSKNLELAKQHIKVLSNLELDKVKRFKFIKDYSIYLISHVIMRLLLSQYTNIKAKEILYQYKENEKPWISKDICFNLSHAHKKAVIGFYKKEIGVDIEYKKELGDYNSIGDLVFSKEEKIYMNRGNKKDKFYELWTKKEAIIKGIGVGLNEEVKDLSVGTKKQFHRKHNQVWQIEKVKEDFNYVAHIAYKSNNIANKISSYIWEF